jgi:hypothetical protein
LDLINVSLPEGTTLANFIPRLLVALRTKRAYQGRVPAYGEEQVGETEMNPAPVGLSVESYERLWPRTAEESDQGLQTLWDSQHDLALQATEEARGQGVMIPEGIADLASWLDLLLAAVAQRVRCEQWHPSDYRGEQDGATSPMPGDAPAPVGI